MKEFKIIKRDKVEGKIVTAREIAEYLVNIVDRRYCDNILFDVIVYDMKINDFWLLCCGKPKQSETVISSRFNTENDVYFANGICEIINNCDLFDFTVINNEIYKIED